MGTPTQVAGVASETLGLAATNGFLGWSPDPDRTPYTLRNGWDGTTAAAYADSTAYAVGKAVTYLGNTYVVRTAVLIANTTKPDVNANFVLIDNHRGSGEQANTNRKPQFFR